MVGSFSVCMSLGPMEEDSGRTLPERERRRGFSHPKD